MRIRIDLRKEKFTLPLAYKHIIQATVYNMMDKKEMGKFYHDKGFYDRDKSYKMFVFSDVVGKYKVINKSIVYDDAFSFSISSLDQELIKTIYQFLIENQYIYIAKQKVKIENIVLFECEYFKGSKEICFKTLSPIVAYRSKNRYFTYFKPSSDEFVNLIKDNIHHKINAYHYPQFEIEFDIKQIKYENKRIVYFKNTFYEAYDTEMIVVTNYDTCKIIFDTGLSAKGSCGFGMVEIKNEKMYLSL